MTTAVSTWRAGGEVSIHIEAPPDVVYEAVADVTRTGERSAECHTVVWLTPNPGTVGSRFRGSNRFRFARWSRTCEVVAAEPGRRFGFRTVPERVDPSRRDSTMWSYTLEPDETGTRVTHAYEITKMPVQPFRALYVRILPHHRDMRPQMIDTLEALRRELEANPT